jgi:hypothetical protein
MAQVAMRIHGLQRSHYDDRMRMAMTWCRYPNLEDHSVSATWYISRVRSRSSRLHLAQAAIAFSDRTDFFLVGDGLMRLRNRLTEMLWRVQANWSKVSPRWSCDGRRKC